MEGAPAPVPSTPDSQEIVDYKAAYENHMKKMYIGTGIFVTGVLLYIGWKLTKKGGIIG